MLHDNRHEQVSNSKIKAANKLIRLLRIYTNMLSDSDLILQLHYDENDNEANLSLVQTMIFITEPKPTIVVVDRQIMLEYVGLMSHYSNLLVVYDDIINIPEYTKVINLNNISCDTIDVKDVDWNKLSKMLVYDYDNKTIAKNDIIIELGKTRKLTFDNLISNIRYVGTNRRVV